MAVRTPAAIDTVGVGNETGAGAEVLGAGALGVCALGAGALGKPTPTIG